MDEFISTLLGLVPVGAGARAVYCLIKMVTDDEQSRMYRRRLVNLLIFTVIAELILGLLQLLYTGYFS